MSLQIAAQHLASRGRGPDTTLVHMAPQEVAGLHALAKAHGGSLTTNPDTGLPEAGFLSKILPTLIGAGLSFIPGVGPLMAAGIVGGGTTLATGSLSKGLMAGLGAYGGAGLASGLAGAGTGALSSAAGSAAANSVVPAVATEAVAPTLLEGAGSAAANMGVAPAYDIMSSGFNAFDPGLGVNMASPINATQMVTQATPTLTQAPVLSQQAADIGNAYAQEQAAQNAVGTALKSNTGFSAGLSELGKNPSRFMTMDNLKYGLAGLSPMLIQDPKQLEEKEKLKPFEYSFGYNQRANPNAGYTGAATGERTYFDPRFVRTAAGGGLMDIGPVQAMSDRNQTETLMANGGQMFAKGGQSHLGDYSDGGRLLKGPGDGVSDSIPATIAEKRPARLADGEFVVPARIVSELGNGSTEAGARKLYAMMDRVQKARGKTVGKNRVAVNSRAENLLPA